MRKVNRGFVPKPEFLSGQEVRAFETELREHFRLPSDQRLKHRAPNPSKLLSYGEISQSLWQVFSGKCAFCESPLSGGGEGNVSHFRPLSNALGKSETRDSPDHYAWFACEWKNLLLVCETCKRSKRNLFPTTDDRRALPMSTWSEANRMEAPLLLDPCKDEPRQHFRFDRSGSVAPVSEKGAITIDVLNLNHDELRQSRWRAFSQVLDNIRELSSDNMSHGTELTRTWEYQGATKVFLQQLCQFAIDSKALRYVLLRADLVTIIEHLRSLGMQRLEEALDMCETAFTRDSTPALYESIKATDLRDIHEQPRLEAITIKNFKGINQLHLPFLTGSIFHIGETNSAMLLGENSTGKSSILQALALALMTPLEISRLKIDAEDFVSRDTGNWQLDKSQVMSVELKFLDYPSCQLSYSFEKNRFVVDRRVPCTLLAYGSRRIFLTDRKGTLNKTLFNPMATIADPSSWLQKLDEHDFNAVARAMRSILALKKEDTIIRDVDGLVLVKAHDRVTPIESMSDGYRSIFAMACDIMRHMMGHWGNLEVARGIVLIDEIETHLHPRWKLRVMSALREAMPQVQFIATTHDPLCLRGMRNGEVKVLFREPNGHVVLREDLPNIESLRAEQILVSDYFGLHSTSDPEQELILAELATIAAEDEHDLSKAKREHRDDLLSKYGGIPLVGASTDRQILTAAITRHLREHPPQTLAQEIGMREESISKIMEVLKRSIQS